MNILVLDHDAVRELLPMRECIPLMAEALASFAKGNSHQPVRMIYRPPGSPGIMAMMPSYRSDSFPVLGLKAICVFPGNPAKGKDTHQGAVMLFSAETGELLAVENASAITAVRTAAVSAVATDILARKGARTLAILGAGVQGRSHLEAISNVRDLQDVRIFDLIPERARRLVEELAPRYPFPVRAMKAAGEAVTGAEIVVTVTSSSEPIVLRDWIAPGTHINAVGACFPSTREIDSSTVAASAFYVDKRESTLQEAGDYLIPLKEGVIGPDHIRAEIGEVLIGSKPGRQSEEEITLYKSLGLAVEDLAAAEYAYRRAQEKALGTKVEF